MEFREAAEIAKQHPGSTLTRDSSGSFIVRHEDGTVIGTATQAGFTALQDSLHLEAANLLKKCEELEGVIRTANTKSVAQERKIEQFQAEITILRAKVSKVSQSEWDRIEETERLEVEEHQRVERDQIMSLVRNQALSYERLRLVLDNSSRFGFSKDDLDTINNELERTRPHGVSPDSFVVYSTTDGQ